MDSSLISENFQKQNLDSLSTPVSYEDPNTQILDNAFSQVNPLEKKELNFNDKYNTGKWLKEEHLNFVKICEKWGNNWVKVQEELKTRSTAQIRSHAQKYIIKLCKKYRIKLKSKKFKHKYPKHLDYVNKAKKEAFSSSPEIKNFEKKLLDTFNYYKREYKPFLIEKIHKDHDADHCHKSFKNKLMILKYQNRIFSIEKNKKLYHKDNPKEKKNFENINLFLLEKFQELLDFNTSFIKLVLTQPYDVAATQKVMNVFQGILNTNKCYANLYPTMQICFDFNESSPDIINELTNNTNNVNYVSQVFSSDQSQWNKRL